MTMRQVVGLAQAIARRKAVDFFQQISLHAQVHGAKLTKSFDEMFPEYTEAEEPLDVTPEAAKLIAKLQQEQLGRLGKA